MIRKNKVMLLLWLFIVVAVEAQCQCDSDLASSRESVKNLIEKAGGIMGITYKVSYDDSNSIFVSLISKSGKTLKSYRADLTNASLGDNIVVYHNPKSEPDEFTLKFKKPVSFEKTKKGEKSNGFLLSGNRMDRKFPQSYMKFGEELEMHLERLICWSSK